MEHIKTHGQKARRAVKQLSEIKLSRKTFFCLIDLATHKVKLVPKGKHESRQYREVLHSVYNQLCAHPHSATTQLYVAGAPLMRSYLAPDSTSMVEVVRAIKEIINTA